MNKTASQIGDIVLEKLAVSPELALKALQRTTRRVPGVSVGTGSAPWEMLLSRMGDSPRTMARAARTIKVPGSSGMKQELLENKLQEQLRGAMPEGRWIMERL